MRSVEEIKAGMKFGLVTTIQQVTMPGRMGQFWACQCDCGTYTTKYAGHLRAGTVKSCGCVKGAHRTHNMSHTPEYKAWDNARSRCYRVKDPKYTDYGGRGIAVCDRWRFSFDNFISDMGRKPSAAYSLDRKDNDGPYSPENCRWATASEQNRNRRPFR